MRKIICSVFLLFITTVTFAQDPTLADAENVRIEGNTLVWDPVPGATGYNINLRYNYYDTVRDATSFELNEPGGYRVVAFNDSGEYGSDYGTEVEYAGDETDASIRYSYRYPTLIVYKTCVNVGPGESCVATCPRTYQPEGYYSALYVGNVTGGACSTSDIVEADAFIGHRTYKCTVPTFSGEVIAQAACTDR